MNEKLEKALEKARKMLDKQDIDMEAIFDALYGCGIWLNENEISVCSKKLQEEFKVLNVKDLK